jgi:sugar phosphate isomerase/epimerase
MYSFLVRLLGLAWLLLGTFSPNFAQNTPMKIKYYCPSWGSNDTWDNLCAKVKKAGYDGIETPIPMEAAGKEEIKNALEKHGLELIAQYYQSFEKNPAENLANYEKHIRNMASMKPVLINTQTGKDYFTFEQNKALIDKAEELSKELGVKIVHETHRNKMLFAAHTTKQYLEKISYLKLGADFSHWCNVHESMLEDQQEAIQLACARAHHIHARVGHQEGPQVNDPRAPEWKYALETHLKWWDAIIEARQKAGDRTMTITPEFGPAGYLPTLPYTQMPVANQWEINAWMMNFLKARYK